MNLRAARPQLGSSDRQAPLSPAPAPILASTPRHFCQSNPSGARNVHRPNGSSLLTCGSGIAGGASLCTAGTPSEATSIEATCKPPDLAVASPSCLASTALMVKKRTGG